jgi:hypothetical protein
MDESLPPVSEIMDHELWTEAQAFSGKRLRRIEKVTFDREQQAKSITEVFHLIGGVPRFAAWADRNPGFFYTKLLTKLLPQAATVTHEGSVNILYRPAIPPSPLDGDPIVTVEATECLE